MKNMNTNYSEKLIDSALDFLQAAIKQIDTDPKASLISFCTAIELFLKARLVYEHWSLIVMGDDPKVSFFKQGKFKSIGFRKLIPRIKNVTNDKISSDMEECFNDLADHRNKMVHFYHEASNDEQARERIAIEQLNGWYFLQQLLTKWDFLIKEKSQIIEDIQHQMLDYKKYPEAVFNRIKPKIGKDEKNGANYRTCTSCKQRAGKETELTEYLYEYDCQICHHGEYFIKTQCSNNVCNATIVIDEPSMYRDTSCDKCATEFHKTPFFEKLDETFYEKKVGRKFKNCGACFGQHESVIEHGGYYICSYCFLIQEDFNVCDWCGIPQIGNDELIDSDTLGCAFCEGRSDYYASKDNS